MMDGRIQRARPICAGGASRLAPGMRMQSESQTSPRTFAKEVKRNLLFDDNVNTSRISVFRVDCNRHR